MISVEVIENPEAAVVALDPIRSRLLGELAEPASAAALASRVGLMRQKIHYHLKILKQQGLIHDAETRRWGGLTERLVVANAASYVVSPSAMGPVGADPAREKDRLSASYMIALAARIVREVGTMMRMAKETNRRLATLSIDTEIRFKSPADRAAFGEELTRTVTEMVARYHDQQAPGGRAHRLIIAAHPMPVHAHPTHPDEKETTCPSI